METIAIPIETKVRELDGKLWLGLNLVSRGNRVILGPHYEVSKMLDIVKPDIYITKDPGDQNIRWFDKLRKAGILVCGLDTEGGVFDSLNQFVSNKHNILNHLDAFFAWGEKPAEEVAKQHKNVDKLYVTGNPRFDLLQPQLRYIYQNEATSFNDRYGDYILINGSFGIANPIKVAKTVSEKKYNSIQQLYTHTYRIFYLFLEVVYYLQSEFPDTDIIIRPHPSEANSTYENAFRRYDRVYVEDSGDVRAWIAGASAVIHHTSTTGIESALMGVPVVSYRPIQNKEYESELPVVASEQAFDREDLATYISKSLKNNYTYDMNTRQTEYVKQYFHNVDVSAAELICDVIESLERRTEKNYQALKPSWKGGIERRIKTSKLSNELISTYDFVQAIIGDGSSQEQRDYYKQKFPGLKKPELINRIEIMNEELNLESVSIERVPRSKNTYIIQYD